MIVPVVHALCNTAWATVPRAQIQIQMQIQIQIQIQRVGAK